MMKYIIVALLLLNITVANGQILEVPLGSNPKLSNYQPPLEHRPNWDKSAGDSIDIPFLDDFNYESLLPSGKYWADQFAYINKGYGVNPPTLGVATLDGIDETGAAYANNGYGVRDYLTSLPIRLGSKTAADNVYLSYYYQKKGYGEKPEIGDSLVVEFKNNQGQWIAMDNIPGVPDSVNPNVISPFAQRTIAIDDTEFLFDGFQFRFKNYGALSGSVDHWHIDYVRITESNLPSSVMNDIAYMTVAKPILKFYSAMPWRHFKNDKVNETNDEYRVDISNYFANTQNINPSQIIIEEAVTQTQLMQTNILSFNEQPIPLGNIPVGQHTVIKTYDPTKFSDIIAGLDNFDNSTTLRVNTYFTVNPSNQDGTLSATLANDTAFAETVFDNYFAYDDGGAELAIVAARSGDEVAVKFHANVADTLRALQIFIPRIAGDITGQQRFNLKVWVGDLNTTPAYRADFQKPVYVDSLNGWTTYSLDTTPVALPVGDFYIGWQQATDPSSPNQAIPVGYDRNNNDKVVNNFMNIGNGWQPLSSGTAPIQDGAIMIRAIVGDFTPFTTNTAANETTLAEPKIYPNPTSGQLFIDIEDDIENYSYRIYNIAGQALQEGNLQQHIEVSSLVNGIYFINIYHRTKAIHFNQKFIKQ